jgi:hypothetical protein
MGRLIAGIACGFAAWFVIFVGADTILKKVWTNYAVSSESARYSNTLLVLLLAISLSCSFAAGFIAAWIARESKKSTWLLGAALVAAALFFRLTDWNNIALWFNVALLVSITPFTILGGYFRK